MPGIWKSVEYAIVFVLNNENLKYPDIEQVRFEVRFVAKLRVGGALYRWERFANEKKVT